MSANLRLQRLSYPLREQSIAQKEFGPSSIKFKAITNFFTCAVMGHPNFANGQIQESLDNLYINKKQVVGHAIDIQFQFAEACTNFPSHSPQGYTRPLFVLGQRNKISAFEKALISASKKYQEDSPLLISGLREFMVAEYLSQREHRDEESQFGRLSPDIHQHLLNHTMGWLDLESGCFAMRSMNALNRVRELFGMRPHMAMMKQRDNYPNATMSSPEPE